jgi:hypothetical protein
LVGLKSRTRILLTLSGAWAGLLLLHYPLIRLPYFWDEAGYYALAAFDFYRQGLLIPHSTWALGHTPLEAVYVGSAWRLFGPSPGVARMAMLLVAAATVIATYELGISIFPPPHQREIAAWSALLLAVSPLFFAQSAMLHIDLPATLFLTLGVNCLLRRRTGAFALCASVSFLSKETSAIFLPVAWAFAWQRRAELRRRDWLSLLSPLLVVFTWTLYYRHQTGFWTGNRQYLEYNIYSTLNPVRFLLSLARRLYQVLVGGSDWVLTAGVLFAFRVQKRRKKETGDQEAQSSCGRSIGAIHHFMFIAGSLCATYILFHSIVGGALLRRYLLPLFPVFFLAAVWYLWRLEKPVARGVCAAAAALFVMGWFLHGFQSFEFESNLAYADFVRLHQEAARYLEGSAGGRRVLTAWPATGELTQPFLQYVSKPLRVVPIDDFGEANFNQFRQDSFDILYLYSRKGESVRAGLMRFPLVQHLNQRYFDYVPQAPDQALMAHYHLVLLKGFERHGQWVHIYSK